MGAVIKSVSVAKPVFRNKILTLSAKAANNCIKTSGINTDDIGLIVHSGVYTENHLKEPALASMIQNRIIHGKKVSFKKKPHINNILSFDLYNGGGGIINAIQVVSGFIDSGEINYGLVVVGDTKPVTGKEGFYDYTPGAGAILLHGDKEERGFAGFKTDTYPEFINDLVSNTDWTTGNFCFTIKQNSQFLDHCIDCSVTSVNNFLLENKLKKEDIDLVITSHSPKKFGMVLQEKLQLKNKMFLMNGNGEIFSSAIIFSLKKIFDNHRFKSAKNVLLITAGSGITLSMALYKNNP